MRDRRTSHLGRLVLLTMPLLLAVAAPVRAQRMVTTSHMYPIMGTHVYSPSQPCPSLTGPADTVTLAGVLHVLTRVPPDAPVGVVEMQTNLLSAMGTGVDGDEYHAVGAPRIALNPVVPATHPVTLTFELIPPPSCEHTPIGVTGEITFNLDGTQNPMASFFTFTPPLELQ